MPKYNKATGQVHWVAADAFEPNVGLFLAPLASLK
jgi:hypothetical protein